MHKTLNGMLNVLVAASVVLGCRQTSPTAADTTDAIATAPAAGSTSPVPSGAATPLPPPAPLPPLPPDARTQDEANTIEVFRRVAPSVVFVTQKRLVVDWMAGRAAEVPTGTGSGFIWDQRGHVVTNFHVIQGARALAVTLFDQKTYPAQVVGVEAKKDIAVLKLAAPSGQLTAVQLAPAGEHLAVGQKAIAIGNPFGLDHTLTTPVVSAVGREVQGIGGVSIRDMVQTDAAINPGNSGGPLLDSRGRLIGMNTMIFSKSGAYAGIGFAVPASTVARVVPQLIQHGRVRQVGMGVQIDPSGRLEHRLGLQGVVILATEANGPAARAGLLGLQTHAGGVALGDVIVGIADQAIKNYDDLYNALDGRNPGDSVSVRVLRNGKEMRFELALIAVQ